MPAGSEVNRPVAPWEKAGVFRFPEKMVDAPGIAPGSSVLQTDADLSQLNVQRILPFYKKNVFLFRKCYILLSYSKGGTQYKIYFMREFILKTQNNRGLFRNIFCVIIYVCFFCIVNNLKAQTAAPTPPIEEPILVNTRLIQLEAIVKDKKGKIITDLKAEDFEIFEENKNYPIEFFSYVPVIENRQIVESTGDKRLQLNQVRRTFVFIVSTPVINMFTMVNTQHGADSRTREYREAAVLDVANVSRVLKHFVKNQIGPNDLVSIIDEDRNLGILSNFTNDKDILIGAAEKISKKYTEVGMRPIRVSVTADGRDINWSISSLVLQNLNVISIAESSIEQLKMLPGRKVVVLLSRGLLGDSHISEAAIVTEKLKNLAEAANKANVTFYSLHLKTLGEAGIGTPSSLQGLDSMKRLAERTGGRAIFNTNDLTLGLNQIVEENNGYYQLAFAPDDIESDKPYKIKIKLKRSDLRIQYRSNVYQGNSVSDNFDSKEYILRLLRSSFATTNIKVTLSTDYTAASDKDGNIRTVVNIDPHILEPKLLDDGIRELDLDLGIQIVRPDNKLQRQDVKKFTLKLDEESWHDTLKNGLVYQFDTKTESIGFYQINIAACVKGSCGTSSGIVNTSTKK